MSVNLKNWEEHPTLTTEELTELERLIDERRAKLELAHDNPYVLNLIKVLYPHGTRGLQRKFVLEAVYRLRKDSGVNIPKNFDEAVQASFNEHNGQSLTFDNKTRSPEDDLFYWVGGKHSRISKWAVHLDKANAWLRKRAFAV